jgi:hypothetical protein
VAEIGPQGFLTGLTFARLFCRQPMICQAQRAMAPNPEPLRSRGAKHSVHDQYWRAGQQSQVTRGDYLCVLSPNGNSSSTRRRMDPAGFEPASATWTECCVPVTPRALSGVSVLVQPSARSCVTILLIGAKLGGNQVPWAALRAGSRLCHSTGAIPTSRKSARCGAPGRCCHNSAHLEVH